MVLRLLKQLFGGDRRQRAGQPDDVVIDGASLQAMVDGTTEVQTDERNMDHVDYFNDGNELADQGHFEAAIEKYSHAINTDPFAEKDYPSQLPPELSDTPFDPDDGIYTSPKSFFNRATAYDALGQFDKAIDDYAHAIRICPEFINAYQNRIATCLIVSQQLSEKKNFEGAERVLEVAAEDVNELESRSESIFELELWVKVERTCLHHTLGRLDEASKLLLEALVLLRYACESGSIDSAEARIGVQRIGLVVEDVGKAANDSKQRMNAVECCLEFGATLKAIYSFDRAEELYRLLVDQLENELESSSDIELETLIAQTHNFLGMLFLDTGRLDDASKEFRAAIASRKAVEEATAKEPLNSIYLAGAWCNLGHSLKLRWAIDEAVDAYNQGIHTLENILPGLDTNPHLKQRAEEFIGNASRGREQAESFREVQLPERQESLTLEITIEGSEPFDLATAFQAIQGFDEQLLQQPDSYATRLEKARLLVRMARALDAQHEIACQVASELDEEVASAWTAPTGQRFFCILHRARESYDHAIEIRPDDPTAYREKSELLGEYADCLGEFEVEGEEARKKASRLDSAE